MAPIKLLPEAAHIARAICEARADGLNSCVTYTLSKEVAKNLRAANYLIEVEQEDQTEFYVISWPIK